MTKIISGANLVKTELQFAVIQNLTDFPANPKTGQICYYVPAKTIYQFDGTDWAPTTFSWRGVFNGSTQYLKKDVVTYNGSTYVALKGNIAVGTLPTDATNWDIMAQGGMSSTYTNATPMPTALGGLPAGHSFSNEPLTQVLTELLYPYQSPGFSSFGITGQSAQLEVGTTITGNKTFTWTTSNSSNVQANSVQILQGSTVIASGLPATGSTTVTIPDVVMNSPGSQTWTIKGTNTNNTTFQSTFTVSWFFYRYNGTSTNTTLTAAQIKALATSALATSGSGAGTYSFAAGGYKYIAYPATFAALTTIKDASNNLPMDMADSTSDPTFSNTANGWSYALVSVTNSLGITQNYRVYRSRNILGGSYTIVTA